MRRLTVFSDRVIVKSEESFMQNQNENWIDPGLSSELKSYAQKILKELELKGLRVRYNTETEHILFTQDRRVVEVPIKLIKNNNWLDIRYLFRAVLGSAPGAWNLTADDNDWTAFKQ